MKTNTMLNWLRPTYDLIATFGKARLIKHRDGRIELLGGSIHDRRAALEWCSHFLHHAAIDVAPPFAPPSPCRPLPASQPANLLAA